MSSSAVNINLILNELPLTAMKTILNVGLGLALAFCIFYFVSGKLDERIDAAVEQAVNERMSALEQTLLSSEEEYGEVAKAVDAVEDLVEAAIAKVNDAAKKASASVAATAKSSQKSHSSVESAAESAVAQAAEAVRRVSETVSTTSSKSETRQYIDVNGPKGAVKLYVGQPKAEILEILGTPDSFNFGGTMENCRYNVGSSMLYITFRNGKLADVMKI